MSLITFNNVSLSYGDHALLDHADFQLEPGERVCLVGCNGTGKSTLLKIIHADIVPDDGVVKRQAEIRVAMLEQEVPPGEQTTVFDMVASGVASIGDSIIKYNEITKQLAHSSDEGLMKQLEQEQQFLDTHDGWNLQKRIDSILSKLDLPADELMVNLSGGYKRRVLLGRALVVNPDVLLLDEPTNHLDVESIKWLEDMLMSYQGALLFITHDRTFLKQLATRIIDLSLGKLTSWPGNYEKYLELKAKQQQDEEKQNALFDKRLAQEEVWIRQGIKARRTRNEGRVRALKAMRNERQQRRERQGKVKIHIENQRDTGRLVAELKDVSLSFPDNPIVSHFSTRIMRGDRVGIIGPNGAGKSTLIKLILGQLKADSGLVEPGTHLEIAYFDQHRLSLDVEKSVIDNLELSSDVVTINGKSRHAVGYLQDFLFTPQRIRSPVKALSGGERNRLLLAKLFTKSCNVLVLDEPTNDLDIDTLELLEEVLMQFQGTILLVSHDRTFVDNIVTSTLAFEGNGKVEEYIGGYSDWERYQQENSAKSNKVNGKVPPNVVAKSEKTKASKTKTSQVPQETISSKAKKLSYKLQRELEQLPSIIEQQEQRKQALETIIGDPGFYKQEPATTQATLKELEELCAKLEQSYQRWAELEE